MKLLLIGPSKTGKSTLASFLAGILDSTTPASEPTPTVGVRILEFTSVGVPIELWDVSGDQSYENTWPACSSNADGVILCYSPETAGHAVSGSARHSPLLRRGPVPCQPCSTHCAPPLTRTPPHCALPPPHTLPLQKEVELFYEWFCVKRGVAPERCACFALSMSGAGGVGVAASAIGGVQPEMFLLRADGGEGVKRAFERFVGRLKGVR
jgi:hypothetical protein